jgi:hypothetical protein
MIKESFILKAEKPNKPFNPKEKLNPSKTPNPKIRIKTILYQLFNSPLACC